MHINEADPAAAILDAGDRLLLFHAADSNRQAVGRGHTDFLALMRALRRVGYAGDTVIECTAAGPDPFTPGKAISSGGLADRGGDGWHEEVRRYTVESLQVLRAITSLV
jgi:sugar phosphate isomerase/epimerase